MRRIVVVVVGSALASALTLAPVDPASAGTPSPAQTTAMTASHDRGFPRRYSADATFLDVDGCLQTFVATSPVAARSQWKSRIAGVSMSLQIYKFNVCTSTPVLLGDTGVIPLTIKEFTMSRDVRSAKLRVSTTMHDSVSGQDFPISIRLRYWRLAPKSQVCSIQDVPDETTIYCLASVNGTVTDGTTNFTPDPGTAVFQEHIPH